MEAKKLIEFVRNNDFMYANGAGAMFATDDETREYIAKEIERAYKIRELNQEEVEEEYSEFIGEIENGCTICEAIIWNESQICVAYYE
jgi:uncharacterized membrane protein YkgB